MGAKSVILYHGLVYRIQIKALYIDARWKGKIKFDV